MEHLTLTLPSTILGIGEASVEKTGKHLRAYILAIGETGV